VISNAQDLNIHIESIWISKKEDVAGKILQHSLSPYKKQGYMVRINGNPKATFTVIRAKVTK